MHKRYSWVLVIVAMLIATGFIATIDKVNAANPTIYVDPATIIGDLNPTPGSVTTVDVKASNIPYPGLWGHEFYLALDKNVFPEYVPITNMNFTTNINGWTTTVSGTPTGVQTVIWSSTDGNPSPGSGVGSFMLRINGTGSAAGSVIYFSEFSFNWPLGILPQDGALLSFAYRISGNSILASSGIAVRAIIVHPDATFYTAKQKTYSFPYPTGWFYNSSSVAGNQFTQTGTYKLRLYTMLKTTGIATTDYAQVNWDDAGLRLAPVSVAEGSFLKSQPPVVPINNMNFTSDTSSWTTGQTGTGTPTSGYDAVDGNPNPGSGVGSLKLRATSTALATANMEFITSQSFSWSSGQPLNAYLSYAFNSIGNSYFPTESTKSPTTNTGAWTTPANAYTSNNVYASSATDAQQHVYGGYGFDVSIPAGVTITKVEVGVEGYTSGNWGINCTVSWDGGTNYYTFPSNSALQTSDTNTVLWNDVTSWTSWTATKLSDANFKVKTLAWKPLHGGASSATVYLDWLLVRVTWKSSSVDVRIVKPDSTVISLLNSIPFNSTKLWSYSKGNIISPSVFSASGTYTLQLVTDLMTNAAGTGNYVQVNWDDVGLILMIPGGSPSTFFTSIYKRYATNNTLYVADTMTGTIPTTSIPVIGGGTLATVKILVGYGAAKLDLYNTILTTVGDPPGYPPIPLVHTAVDGYFRNKLTGDINGDKAVDRFDFGLFASAYGSSSGPPPTGNWNREADLNNDGAVDRFDFGIFAQNYGRTTT